MQEDRAQRSHANHSSESVFSAHALALPRYAAKGRTKKTQSPLPDIMKAALVLLIAAALPATVAGAASATCPTVRRPRRRGTRWIGRRAPVARQLAVAAGLENARGALT